MSLIRNASPLPEYRFAHREFADYYNNPEDRFDRAPKVEHKIKIDKTIDQCLNSRPVRKQIEDACSKYKGYSSMFAYAVLRAVGVFSKSGVNSADQQSMADHAGMALSTFSKYYRFLVDLGFMQTKHKWKVFKKWGSRQAANKTILVVLIAYCKRCAGWKSSKHGVSCKNPSDGDPNTLLYNTGSDYCPEVPEPPHWLAEKEVLRRGAL